MARTSDVRFTRYWRVSLIWGIFVGFLAYVAIRFPWWLVLNVPDNGQRGPFLELGEMLAAILIGVVISALVFRSLMHFKNPIIFSTGYLLVPFVLPFILLALSIFPSWFVSPGSSDLLVPIVGWIFASLLPQVCLLPVGLLAAVVFYWGTKSR